MNNKFDELTKGLAQSVTRRAALKKFGVGLTGVVLATLGLANKAEARPKPPSCLAAGSVCGHDRSLGTQAHCRTVCCSHNSRCVRDISTAFVCRCL